MIKQIHYADYANQAVQTLSKGAFLRWYVDHDWYTIYYGEIVAAYIEE